MVVLMYATTHILKCLISVLQLLFFLGFFSNVINITSIFSEDSKIMSSPFTRQNLILLSFLNFFSFFLARIFFEKIMIITPSFVQVQLVHGEIFLEDPRIMSSPFTRHCVTSSRQ